eukprot:6387960-Amphidinium_carterae.1
MDNILVQPWWQYEDEIQPWWQYEDEIAKYEVHDIEKAMNKEISQLVSKKSFVEVDASTLSQDQLKKVVGTRWVINDRPSNSG